MLWPDVHRLAAKLAHDAKLRAYIASLSPAQRYALKQAQEQRQQREAK